MRAPALVAVVAVALLDGAASAAQMELGDIKGRVVDDAGAPVAEVTIRLVNADRAREITLKTGMDGRFRS